MLTYYKARALADALEMLERPDVEGRALLGGTDLLVSLAGKHDETPRVVVDLKGIKDWGEPLVITDTGVRIGLMLTMAELAADPVVGSWYGPDRGGRQGRFRGDPEPRDRRRQHLQRVPCE